MAAVIVAVCVTAGCSLKEQVPENTKESEESRRETKASTTEIPTTKDTQQTTEKSRNLVTKKGQKKK